jgi:hypothetical protein
LQISIRSLTFVLSNTNEINLDPGKPLGSIPSNENNQFKFSEKPLTNLGGFFVRAFTSLRCGNRLQKTPGYILIWTVLRNTHFKAWGIVLALRLLVGI